MKIRPTAAMFVIGVALASCGGNNPVAPAPVPGPAPVPPPSLVVTLSAAKSTLSLNESVEISAHVTRADGQPAPDGSLVRFVATSGTVTPAQASTVNGIARTTFQDSACGLADIRAADAAAATPATSEALTLSVGLRDAPVIYFDIFPSSVPSTGGSTQVRLNAIDDTARPIVGAPCVPITLSTTAGTLSASSGVTGDNGRLDITITTTTRAFVSATIGLNRIVRSAWVEVEKPPDVSVTMEPVRPVAGQPATLVLAFTYFVLYPVRIEWGDGTADWNTLPGRGSRPLIPRVAHVYTSPGEYTLRATSQNYAGETMTVTLPVTVTAPVGVGVTYRAEAPFVNTPYVFTVVPDASAMPVRVVVDFGDGSPVIDLGAITVPTQVTKQYTAPGSYVARVTQVNANGSTSAASVTALVFSTF